MSGGKTCGDGCRQHMNFDPNIFKQDEALRNLFYKNRAELVGQYHIYNETTFQMNLFIAAVVDLTDEKDEDSGDVTDTTAPQAATSNDASNIIAVLLKRNRSALKPAIGPHAELNDDQDAMSGEEKATATKKRLIFWTSSYFYLILQSCHHDYR